MFEALQEWWERRRALQELRAIDDEGGFGLNNEYFLEQIDDARKAFERQDRARALKTWRELNERYPGRVITSKHALNLLVDLGGYDEAEALLRKGGMRYPRYRAMYAAVYAYVAQGRGDIEETLRRCAVLRRKFPRAAEGYTIAADCLARVGRDEEAETIIERAARRGIVVAHARHAVRRKDGQTLSADGKR